MRVQSCFTIALAGLVLTSATLAAQTQTAPGQGNEQAVALSKRSPMVQSAMQYLMARAATIRDARLKKETLDVVSNPAMCVQYRAGMAEATKKAIVQQLIDQGLADKDDDAKFPGGLIAGIFPPVLDEGSSCPKQPQPFSSAPGGAWGNHHSYPGGLAVHVANNETASIMLAAQYRGVYGYTGPAGLPVVNRNLLRQGLAAGKSAIAIDQDIVVAGPLWHDWAKTLVFQWNADGSEFREFFFGGNGSTDNYGAVGNSKVGAHHITGAAESMKRGLPADFVVSQISAHAAPTNGDEYKVVNWLRAAALLAQVDPVAKGYLTTDKSGRLRLPAVRKLGSIDLLAATPTQTNLLAEYALHSLSDADFNYSIPSVTSVQVLLQTLAPQFGYDPAKVADYNNRYRNPVLSYMTAERLLILYSEQGLEGLSKELKKLRTAGII